VLVAPPDGADPALLEAVAAGTVRLAEPLAKATLPAAEPGPVGLERSWRVSEYREQPLPLMLQEVPPGNERARFRKLFGSHESVEVAPGQILPGTEWELVAVRRVIGSAKDDGSPEDLSYAEIRPPGGAAVRRVAAGVAGLAGEPAALLEQSPGGQLVLARRGDTFRIQGDPADYRVVDLGPQQMVIENLATNETHTLPRR
jgi:hypothetical protein